MSRDRYTTRAPFDAERALGTLIDGRPMCRWCGKPCKGRRESFCSTDCVREYMIRASSSFLRLAVLERDHGICARCRLDCRKLEAAMHALKDHERVVFLLAAGFKPHDARRRSLWDADHVKPVVMGGGAAGLDNLRTLCVKCHREVTRHLAGKRAALRKAGLPSEARR